MASYIKIKKPAYNEITAHGNFVRHNIPFRVKETRKLYAAR